MRTVMIIVELPAIPDKRLLIDFEEIFKNQITSIVLSKTCFLAQLFTKVEVFDFEISKKSLKVLTLNFYFFQAKVGKFQNQISQFWKIFGSRYLKFVLRTIEGICRPNVKNYDHSLLLYYYPYQKL